MAISSPSKSAIEKKNIDRIGFLLTLAVLSVLWIQSAFQPFKQGTLAGAEARMDIPTVHWSSWSSGELQCAIEHNAGLATAFRPALVRTINQAWFTLFGEHTPQVVRGSDGQLFEGGYRNAVCGLDFVGLQTIEANMLALDAFNRRLISKGKKLVIVIAPNKWRTYSNQVPWNCVASQTNYAVYTQQLRQRGYTVCDMVDLFVYDHQQGPAYPLHAKQGTHWSVFGAAVSADYLRFSFAEQAIRLPRISIAETTVDSFPRNTDKDLFELLNLWQRPEMETLAYPTLKAETGVKPNVVVVGDSYYWTYYYLGLHQALFDANSTFWYYNTTLVGSHIDDRQPLTDQLRETLLQNADAVLLVMSEPSLANFGFGLLSHPHSEQ